MNSPHLDVVLAWHSALNAGAIDRLIALCTDDVEVGGPRGAGRGSDLLRDWVARAQIELQPGRWQARDRTVVVEELARWRTEDGQWTEPRQAASVFRVEGGKIASIIRLDDFAAALRFAGLDPSPGG